MTRSSSSGWTLAFGLIGAAFALACGLAFAGTAHPPRAVAAKYMNGYREFAGKKVAPGWSNWFTVLSHTQYYKYVASEDGHRRNFGKRPGDYITRVLGRKATGLINQYAKQRRPFFLQLDE